MNALTVTASGPVRVEHLAHRGGRLGDRHAGGREIVDVAAVEERLAPAGDQDLPSHRQAREVAALAIVHPVLGSVDAGAAQDHRRQPALAVHLEQVALAAHLVGAVGVEPAGLVARLDDREESSRMGKLCVRA